MMQLTYALTLYPVIYSQNTRRCWNTCPDQRCVDDDCKNCLNDDHCEGEWNSCIRYNCSNGTAPQGGDCKDEVVSKLSTTKIATVYEFRGILKDKETCKCANKVCDAGHYACGDMTGECVKNTCTDDADCERWQKCSEKKRCEETGGIQVGTVRFYKHAKGSPYKLATVQQGRDNKNKILSMLRSYWREYPAAWAVLNGGRIQKSPSLGNEVYDDTTALSYVNDEIVVYSKDCYESAIDKCNNDVGCKWDAYHHVCGNKRPTTTHATDGSYCINDDTKLEKSTCKKHSNWKYWCNTNEYDGYKWDHCTPV